MSGLRTTIAQLKTSVNRATNPLNKGIYKTVDRYVFRPGFQDLRNDITVFRDDGKANVESAAELGIKPFLTLNGEDWTSEIYNYLR